MHASCWKFHLLLDDLSSTTKDAFSSWGPSFVYLLKNDNFRATWPWFSTWLASDLIVMKKNNDPIFLPGSQRMRKNVLWNQPFNEFSRKMAWKKELKKKTIILNRSSLPYKGPSEIIVYNPEVLVNVYRTHVLQQHMQAKDLSMCFTP